MSDVVFVDLLQGLGPLDVVVIDSVPRIDPEAERDSDFHALAEDREFPVPIVRPIPSPGKASGVQLHPGGSDFRGRLQLGGIRIDEHAGGNSRVDERTDRFPGATEVAHHVESSLGGDFLAVFRNQADAFRFQFEGQLHHFRSEGNLKIEPGPFPFQIPLYVLHLHVPAVFADVHGDSIGPRILGQPGKSCGIGFYKAPMGGGFVPVTGLPQGCDVIDVDT